MATGKNKEKGDCDKDVLFERRRKKENRNPTFLFNFPVGIILVF